MQSALIREPFHRPGWVSKEKYDGWRMLAFKGGHRVRRISRQGVDHATRFGELAPLLLPCKALIVNADPWLTLSVVIRSMLSTNWDDDSWP